MRKRFQTLKMEGKYWGVFLINPNDPTDRYLVSSPLDKQSEAESLAAEFNRIAAEVPKTEIADSRYDAPKRKIRLD